MKTSPVILVVLAACGSPASPTTIEPTAPSVAAAPEPPPVIATTATPPACEGPDRRLIGSTCCESTGAPDEKVPGMTYLTCFGPQVGTACAAKTDCDVACSCDDPLGMLSPGNDRAGPPDGTHGVSGVCGGRLQIGVWMCQIDEHGAVSHLIVD